MTELDRVIHEPARLLIVALLASVKEADFLWVLRESELTKGNLSSHLVRLEEAGYVEVEKNVQRQGSAHGAAADASGQSGAGELQEGPEGPAATNREPRTPVTRQARRPVTSAGCRRMSCSLVRSAVMVRVEHAPCDPRSRCPVLTTPLRKTCQMTCGRGGGTTAAADAERAKGTGPCAPPSQGARIPISPAASRGTSPGSGRAGGLFDRPCPRRHCGIRTPTSASRGCHAQSFRGSPR